MLSLIDMMRASSRNRYNPTRIGIYLVAFLFALSRATISPYIEMLNTALTPQWANLIYVSVVSFAFYFFSTLIGGPATFNAIGDTIKQSALSLKRFAPSFLKKRYERYEPRKRSGGEYSAVGVGF